MMAHGETLGVLHLCGPLPPASEPSASYYRIGGDEQRLAVTVSERLSLALANLNLRETLRSQSIRDPLTGLFNRRYMEESLEREMLGATRKQRPLSLIMFDLDHFKRFNDTFGHEAGDVVLREIGDFLQKHVRGEDIACRYGGEEFVLILGEAPIAVAQQRAEQIRAGIRQMAVRYRGQSLGSITASLGVASFPEDAQTSDVLLHAADQALYRAKAAGRDRVMAAHTG
jgi:diguanylate cyclase (GGDEF)-like protein